MMIEVKAFSGEFKADGSGALVATFSTFKLVDHDGDVTLASAIPDGLEVPLGAFNHASLSGAVLPIGKGYIRNDGDRAQIVAEIFPTSAAQAEYAVIKGLGRLAEYSWSFKPLEVSTDARELAPYGPTARRIIKAVDIVEVCSVIRAAGINTGTDSAKRTLVRLPLDLVERLADVRQSSLMRIDDELIESLRTEDQSRFMRL